ncbi:Ubiquitin--protein ligase [Bertholletia excelsa]
MEEMEVPHHFLCPISMQLMRDPVTVSTGITYDRHSIETWLFSYRKRICPVTKQPMCITDPTPNHTLRRLIQAWCTLNASSEGIEQLPTPNPTIDSTQIAKLLNDAKKSPHSQLKCLQILSSIACSADERSKMCLEVAGAVEFLASIQKRNQCSDEALRTLFHLQVSEEGLKKLNNDGEFVQSLINVLKCNNSQSRAHAVMIIKSIFEVAEPIHLINVRPELFVEIGEVLKDKISQQASNAALKLLIELCPWGRNRIKAVEAGAVMVMVELLHGTNERRTSELVLSVLEKLCTCAEGRAELLNHGSGLAAVSKKILRVSHVATDRAVKILLSKSRFSATSGFLQEMLQVGAVSKLCLVLQVETSAKTRDKTKEILKIHLRVWPHLLACYPSS